MCMRLSGIMNTSARTDKQGECCSQRWIIAYIGLWLGIMTTLLNANMSVAVVCMVGSDRLGEEMPMTFYGDNATNTSSVNSKVLGQLLSNISLFEESNQSEFSGGSNDILKQSPAGEFKWNKKTQSFILSGYFYGYMVMQVPGGWLGTKFGGRRVIGISMGAAALLTSLIPVMSRTNVYLTVTTRILLGLFIGLSLTNFCGLIGVWALPTERSRMTGLLWFGQMFGVVIAYSTSGLLCVHGFDNGWASIFYLHGIFGAVFIGCWWYFVYDSPAQHPRIKNYEKDLILDRNGRQKSNTILKKQTVPWKKISTYPPLYVSYVAHACDAWTFYFLVTCLPQYLNEVLHFDIQSNGFLSCLPFVSLMVGIAISGAAADYIRLKNIFSITTIRKIFLIIGFLGLTCFILVPGFLTSDLSALAIACICLCTLFEASALTGGYSTNAVDIAPRYASVVFGISNTLASIPGVIVPYIVAVITPNRTVDEWRIVFYITAGISVFACVVYGLFANNEHAPWADMQENMEIKVELSSDLYEKSTDAEEKNDLLAA